VKIKAGTLAERARPNSGHEACVCGRSKSPNNQDGIALVVTLLAVAIITAMVVEFSYAVYTGTNNLYNWRDSQRLSVMAKSGINVSARFLSDWLGGRTFSYPGSMDFPVENPFEDFSGTIVVRIEDENSKFDINSVVPENQIVDVNDGQSPYNMFKRLLAALSLNEKIADRVADWIDRDSQSRLTGSEAGAKNLPFSSVDELLSVNGISRKEYETLLPYITVYGNRDAPEININGAAEPVLMSLSSAISKEDAKRIIQYRDNTPFQGKSDLARVSGFPESKVQSLMNKITTIGTDFSIKSVAASGGVKRIIETVFNCPAKTFEYWKEY
jgi:general secretion pathway protein K